VLAIVSGGYLLGSWAMNPVSSILPTITADLNIDVARAGWLMNAYFVLLVSWVLIAGRLGDASATGPLPRWLPRLRGWVAAGGADGRLHRATRGARCAGHGLGNDLRHQPGHHCHGVQRPRLAWAVGILTISAGVSSLAGTWVSTTLVEYANWHWSFLVPALFGLGIALFAGGLPSVRRTRLADIDWLGGVLLPVP